MMLIACSCLPQKSVGRYQIESGPDQLGALENALRIENGINRGTSFTDAMGIDYNIRYIPIKIVNDGVIPIDFQIGFTKGYNYPRTIEEEQFKVIPLPKEWAMDGMEITKNMFNDIPKLMNKPSMHKILQPGEELVFGIGTIYPLPAKICGVLPNFLLSQSNKELYLSCDDNLKKTDKSTNSQLELWLKLDFCRNSTFPTCQLIPCGQISFLED